MSTVLSSSPFFFPFSRSSNNRQRPFHVELSTLCGVPHCLCEAASLLLSLPKLYLARAGLSFDTVLSRKNVGIRALICIEPIYISALSHEGFENQQSNNLRNSISARRVRSPHGSAMTTGKTNFVLGVEGHRQAALEHSLRCNVEQAGCAAVLLHRDMYHSGLHCCM